jgi:hypothetical protein
MESKSNVPIDPTANVLKLVESSIKRLDDLSANDNASFREVISLNKEILNLHIAYQKELRVVESARLDAIRTVDAGALALANEKAAAQASLLATQLQQYDERSRNLQATTATTIATQFTNTISPIVERLGALEKFQYGNMGTTQGKEQMSKSIIAIIGLCILIAGFVIGNFFKN